MFEFERGKYRARLAANENDMAAAFALRALAFRGDPTRDDRDRHDGQRKHILVENMQSGQLVCTFRMLPLLNGSEIKQSYTADYYDLTALGAYPSPMGELGRFCIHPDIKDPEIFRTAWGAMTRFVDGEGIEMLFGATSFAGVDPAEYHDCFALLGDRHGAPEKLRPGVAAPEVIQFSSLIKSGYDRKQGLSKLPPLLRSYLSMGGWVSDHAVIDRDLGTMHVFTGFEIAAVPPSRARILRAVAG